MLISPCNYLRTHHPLVSSVLDTISALGIVPVVVGGAVRDWIMGRPFEDIDIEVFNIESVEHLQFLLKPLGKLELVGRAFGVLRYQSPEGSVDFTLPRRELKTHEGHTGFSVDFDPQLSFESAAARRDFTINAIGLDWVSNQVLDPFNGVADIRARQIRHVGSQFSEDPLRVLRVIQFAARLQFSVHPDTVALCRLISVKSLSVSRIVGEVSKVMLQAETPSLGLALLDSLGVLRQWVELDRYYHSEFWQSGLDAVDRMGVQLNTQRKLGFMLAAWLYHSLNVGKDAIASEFLGRIFESKRQRLAILNLMRWTRKLASSGKELPTDAVLRKASTQTQLRHVATLLSAVLPKHPQLNRYVVARSTALGILDQPPAPLVGGKDLIRLGIPEGPHLGELLSDFYEAQLAGKIVSKTVALQIAQDMWFGDSEEEEE